MTIAALIAGRKTVLSSSSSGLEHDDGSRIGTRSYQERAESMHYAALLLLWNGRIKRFAAAQLCAHVWGVDDLIAARGKVVDDARERKLPVAQELQACLKSTRVKGVVDANLQHIVGLVKAGAVGRDVSLQHIHHTFGLDKGVCATKPVEGVRQDRAGGYGCKIGKSSTPERGGEQGARPV